MRHILPLALLLATPTALAASGKFNAFGPYDVNPALTTGDAVGFRQLFLDPAQVGSLLEPAEALGDSTDDALHIDNRSTAWMELSVSGVRVGIIGPLTSVVLQGVKPGLYETTQTAPTGMVVDRSFKSDSYDSIKAEAARLAAEQAAMEAAAEEQAAEGETEAAPE